MCGEVFSDEMSKRFIDRMRANYKFYAGLFRVHHRYLKHRVLSHSLLVVVSAREVKKVGAHSALRKLPWYLLKMCGEMLV